MAHYVGPKGRVNRRLGALIFESAGAAKALERRNFPPGMFTRRGKLSNYAIALNEKQKIKYYYGIGERQLRRYFERASRMPGNTGENMLLLCERRLDNVIRRAGLTVTRPQSRQGITHWHFRVNGVKVDKPSFLVRPGDVVTVRERANIQQLYQRLVEEHQAEPLTWVTFEPDQLRVTVRGYPSVQDISLPVDITAVVEFMSR